LNSNRALGQTHIEKCCAGGVMVLWQGGSLRLRAYLKKRSKRDNAFECGCLGSTIIYQHQQRENQTSVFESNQESNIAQ
jgi:hypothetical protein